MKYNNRHELRMSQQLLSYLKSDLKQVRKAAKHQNISQLIRYFIIKGMTDIYGDNWTDFMKTENLPEYEEFIKLQSGFYVERYKSVQERIQVIVERRNKGEWVDFQLPLFTED